MGHFGIYSLENYFQELNRTFFATNILLIMLSRGDTIHL